MWNGNSLRPDILKPEFLPRGEAYVKGIVEAVEMVPMNAPPSAQIRFWREQPPEKRDRDAIRAFAYDLGLTLKKYCLIY